MNLIRKGLIIFLFLSSTKLWADFKYYNYKVSEKEDTTISESFVDKLKLRFIPEAGNYMIIGTAELSNEASYETKCKMLINGNACAIGHWEPKESGEEYQPFITHKDTAFTASPCSVQIQYCTENDKYDAYIRRARVIILKLITYEYTDSGATEKDVGNTETVYCEVIFTPPTAGDYLIFATTEYKASAGDQIYIRLKVDGAVTDEDLKEGKDTKSWHMFGAMKAHNFTAASHTIQIAAQNGGTNGTYKIRRPRITVMRLTGYHTYEYDSSEVESSYTGSSNFQDKDSLKFTPSEEADYIVICNARIKGGNRLALYEGQLDVDGDTSAYQGYEPKDINEYRCFISFRAEKFDASEHKIMLRYRTSNGNQTVRIKNARLFASRLGHLRVWQGGSSASWNSGDNWSLPTVPDSAYDVIIPDSNIVNYNPALSGTNYCKTITIQRAVKDGLLSGGSCLN
ncbi:hypothetical protein KAW65_06300, partial [candidate division WOR-3 bacterium]|nr:hypothetical protein [candidate division WOR-3 bacterium]